MLLLDTSGLLAAIDGAQRRHAECAAALRADDGPFLLSPFVLAELDYLIGSRVGTSAQTGLLAEVARGAYRLEPFGPDDVEVAIGVLRKYANLAPGLADASIVVLADRHRCRDVLTLDRRHFGTMRQLNGRPFLIVPA